MPWSSEKRAVYMKQWRAENRDKIRAQKRRYYERYPERKQAEAAKHLVRKRDERNASRAHACEVCGGGPTVYDHCHEFGHFRGWLCNGCNSALGFAKDDPETLRKLAAYLEADWYRKP